MSVHQYLSIKKLGGAVFFNVFLIFHLRSLQKIIIPNFWRNLCVYFFQHLGVFSTSSANLKANCCGFGGLAPPLFCLGTSPRPSWQPPPPFGWEEVSSPANTNTVTEAKECEASTDLAFERIDVFNTAPRFHYSPETKGRWNSGRFRGENQSSPKRPRNQCKNDFGDGPVVGFTSFFWENHGTSLMKHAPKAIQKLVRFLKNPVDSNTQGKRLPPQRKDPMAGWKIHHKWLRWMDPIENEGFFSSLPFFGGSFFSTQSIRQKSQSDKTRGKNGNFFLVEIFQNERW